MPSLRSTSMSLALRVLLLLLLPVALVSSAATASDYHRRLGGHHISVSHSSAVTVAQAVAWLNEHRPNLAVLANVNASFVTAHATEAVRVRAASPWAQGVSDEIFLEYVLPYSHFDEQPELWMASFNQHLHSLIPAGTTSARTAASAVLAGIWGAFGTPNITFHSNSTPGVLSPLGDLLGRTRYGSCTAMSIFLADGLRSVGVPARVVGINTWNRASGGNHNWVEAYFDGRWNFIDSAPGESNWNHAWFTGDAARSVQGGLNGIYTTTWNGAASNGTYVVGWRDPALRLNATDITWSYLSASSSSLAQPGGAPRAAGSPALAILAAAAAAAAMLQLQ